MKNVLYIHGMGGGSDSRIPLILAVALAGKVNVVVRTYDFDPEVASGQIAGWMQELKPSLVIGESLGSLHALKQRSVPRLFISPALNASIHFQFMAWLALIPGVTCLFDRIYRPRPGDRQRLHFTFSVLRKYRRHRKEALSNNQGQNVWAFFGTNDHYMKSGVVRIKTWTKYFGDTFTTYEGTHFMEEEYVYSLLIPKILKVLDIK